MARGHEVSVLVDTTQARDLYRELGAEVVPGSVYQLAALEAGLARQDVAIFFGGDMPKKLLPKAAEITPYDRLRRDGMRNFVSAVLRQRAPLLVVVSSVVVYGHNENTLVDESAPIKPPGPAHSFADMEDILRQGGEFQGLKWVLLRAGFVYSAHDWHTRNLFSQLAAGKIPPLAGEQSYVSPIHTEDLAEAVVCAVENAPAGSTFNVVDDRPVRLNELLAGAAHAMGVKSPGALPSFLIRLYMGKDLYRLLQTSCRVSNQRAKDLLGWKLRFPSVMERLEEEVALWRKTYDTARTADARPRTRTPEAKDV